MKEIKIKPPYIKLEQFIKFAAESQTGGQAKILILEGNVKVNGETCLMRGKKLKGGEKVEIEGGGTYVCAVDS